MKKSELIEELENELKTLRVSIDVIHDVEDLHDDLKELLDHLHSERLRVQLKLIKYGGNIQ